MSIKKELTWIEGFITHQSEVETINRVGKDPVEKITLTIEREDGQKGYFEARKPVIIQMHKKKINVGDRISFGFVFVGSEKNGKIYNNFFINAIEHATTK